MDKDTIKEYAIRTITNKRLHGFLEKSTKMMIGLAVYVGIPAGMFLLGAKAGQKEAYEDIENTWSHKEYYATIISGQDTIRTQHETDWHGNHHYTSQLADTLRVTFTDKDGDGTLERACEEYRWDKRVREECGPTNAYITEIDTLNIPY